MKHDYEPLLHPVAIATLRPTQITVGLREVARKRVQWRKHAKSGADFLGNHILPVVIGPKRRPYLIDHHHLVRALEEEGIRHVLVSIIVDLSGLKKLAFQTFMDNRNWLHPFDANGIRRPISRIPKTIGALVDDPYRSLAGELRRAGGYAKDNTAYSEFLWADYLRRKVDRKMLEHKFQSAVKRALDLAHRPDACHLPGWCGPHD